MFLTTENFISFCLNLWVNYWLREYNAETHTRFSHLAITELKV